MVKWIRFLQKPIAHNDGNVRFFGLLIHTPVCVYRCFSLGGGGRVRLHRPQIRVRLHRPQINGPLLIQAECDLTYHMAGNT